MLPDVSFTNNLGTITLKTCLVSVVDNWQWNGSHPIHQKRVQVDGTLLRGNVSEELYENIVTDPRTIGKSKGKRGNLTLPWTTISDVYIDGMDMPSGKWLDSQPISISFTDDNPENNAYSIHWFDFELHSPHVHINWPTRILQDEYPQMPWTNNANFITNGPGGGVMRTKLAEEMIMMSVSGTIMIEDGKLPTNWEAFLTCREGWSNIPAVAVARSMAGWPKVFHMSEASAELSISMPLVNLILTDGRLDWDIEAGTGRVSIELLAQPQQFGVTP